MPPSIVILTVGEAVAVLLLERRVLLPCVAVDFVLVVFCVLAACSWVVVWVAAALFVSPFGLFFPLALCFWAEAVLPCCFAGFDLACVFKTG